MSVGTDVSHCNAVLHVRAGRNSWPVTAHRSTCILPHPDCPAIEHFPLHLQHCTRRGEHRVACGQFFILIPPQAYILLRWAACVSGP